MGLTSFVYKVVLLCCLVARPWRSSQHSLLSFTPTAVKSHPVPSKVLFKKLLNKIRTQKSLWTLQPGSEEESGLSTSARDSSSRDPVAGTETSAGEGSGAGSQGVRPPQSRQILSVGNWTEGVNGACCHF